MKISSIVILGVLAANGGEVSAFSQGNIGHTFLTPVSPRSNSHLNALPVGGSELFDLHSSATAALDSLHQTLTSSSAILADAAVDVADVAAEDNGLWQQYLNVFKGCLMTVHSAVDQPLRNIGWDQTWGLSIFLFTAGVRSLLIPLSVQQTKSSEYMKALKPYQDEIKEKYKDNKDAQNRAIAKLFEDANQNPLAGCLVAIVQLPIFLGLYRSVTLLAKDGQLNEPFLWIPSLEGPVSAPTYRGIDWLTQGWTFPDGGFPTPGLGWETTLAFMIMPVILVLGQKLTMSVLTPGPDENSSAEEKEQFEKTQGFLKFLPLLIGFFSLQVPAGLTIYWATSNSFTLLQSVAVRGYYQANPPEINLPDYWDNLDDVDNMSADEMREAASAGLKVGPTMEQLADESTFHYVVDRSTVREKSDAWKRVKANGSEVPVLMSAWVESGSDSSVLADEVEAAKM